MVFSIIHSERAGVSSRAVLLFDILPSLSANQAGGELALIISALVGNARIDTGDVAPGFLQVTARPVLFGKSTLRSRQLLFVSAEKVWVPDFFARREDHQGGDAQIEPDPLWDHLKKAQIFF